MYRVILSLLMPQALRAHRCPEPMRGRVPQGHAEKVGMRLKAGTLWRSALQQRAPLLVAYAAGVCLGGSCTSQS